MEFNRWYLVQMYAHKTIFWYFLDSFANFPSLQISPRSYFRLPFTCASYLLSESPERASYWSTTPAFLWEYLPPGTWTVLFKKWRNILVVRDIDPLSMACRLFQNYFRIVCSKTSRNFHWLLNGKTKMYFFQNIVNEIVKTWRCDVITFLRYVFQKNLILLFTCMCWSVDER